MNGQESVVMDVSAALAEIDEVFERCGASPDDPTAPSGGFYNQDLVGNGGEMVSAIVGAIRRNTPDPGYLKLAEGYAQAKGIIVPGHINRLLGVLLTVRKDLEAGYGRTLERRAQEVVYDDMLTMAEAIARDMHSAPAVVLAVSVLEEHVRKMCETRGIPTIKRGGKFRSFEDMANDLGADHTLSLPERRQAGGWYAHRTEAAHGRFDKVPIEEVPRIIGGIRDFMVRHSS